MKTAKNFDRFTLTKKALQGYTLVELLVGLTIMVIIFGVGIAGYREFSRRQALTGVSKQLKADLRLAQQLAVTGQKPEGVSCDVLNGYIFSRVSASNYKILADCTSTVGNQIINTTPEFKSVDLGTDITLSMTEADNSFMFKILGQGTDLTLLNTLTLSQTSGNQIYILVAPGGAMR